MFTDISDAIRRSKKILIIPHYNADGDCLGSSYALKLMLEELGKKADVILDEKDYDNSIVIGRGSWLAAGVTVTAAWARHSLTNW